MNPYFQYFKHYSKDVFSNIVKGMVFLCVISGILFIFANIFSSNSEKKAVVNNSYSIQQRESIYKTYRDLDNSNDQGKKITSAALKSFFCMFIGELCTTNPKEADKYVKKSFIGSVSNIVTMPLANPPASGIYYANQKIKDVGFMPKSYASEGIGFGALKIYQDIWLAFRNLSFLLLVLFVVILGFLIMFKMKINPQTAITLENSLPKIVLTLIFISFSYAIVGFMIDLMYFMIYFIISLLAPNKYAEYANVFTNFSIFSFLLVSPNIENGTVTQMWTLSSSLLDMLHPLLLFTLHLITGLFIWVGTMRGFESIGISRILNNIGVIGNTAGEAPSAVIGVIIAAIVGGLGFLFGAKIIITILIMISILFLVFRIFFMLLKTYVKIILLLIFSPIIILFEIFPGKNAFFSWLKNVFGEIVTFPIVVALIMISSTISEKAQQMSSASNLWTPPLLNSYVEVVNTNFSSQTFLFILGMGIFFMIPEIVGQIKESLGLKSSLGGMGVIPFFGGVAAGVGGAQSLLGSYGSLSLATGFRPLQRMLGTDPKTGAAAPLSPGSAGNDQHVQQGR